MENKFCQSVQNPVQKEKKKKKKKKKGICKALCSSVNAKVKRKTIVMRYALKRKWKNSDSWNSKTRKALAMNDQPQKI